MAEMTYAVHTGTCTYLLDDEGVCLWTVSPGGSGGGTDRCVGAQFVACLDLSAPGGLVGELRLGASALFVRREHGKFVLLRTMAIERVEYREQTDDEAQAQRGALSSQDATAVLADEIPLPQAHAEDPHTPDPEAPLRPLPPPPAPPAYRVDTRGPETEPLPAQAHAWALQQAEVMRAQAQLRPPPEPWEVPGAAVAPPRWDATHAVPGGMPIPHLAYEVPEHAEALDAEDLVSISVTEVTLTMPLYRPPPGAVQPAPPAPAPPPRLPPPHAPPVRREAPPAYALPPPAAPPRRASSFPPPPPDHPSGDAGPPTPRGPPPARPAVVGPGRRLR